jgi:3-phenylpropionate/cinnamic acid dioxygenase small subunit
MKSVLNSDPQSRGALGRGQRVRAGEQAYFEALDFLVEEAELLDQNRFDEWFELLDTGITYKMPVRVTVRRADGDGFAGNMAHFDDDYASLGVRVRRFNTQTAWAEDPPSRAKRLVTNVRVERVDDSEDELRVLSYLLLLRSRWDSPQYEQILAERDDLLRRSGPAFKLRRRVIRVEQSNIGTINLALFL